MERSVLASLIETLADEYPQVRAAAIQDLETLQPSGEWRQHLVHECYVPAGEFIVGEGEKAHPVNVDAFYIAKTPVTNADYNRYADDQGIGFKIPDGKANHPVARVNWYKAREYANWARMRLPTEAQWEKAASWDDGKGVKREYPWGDDFDQNRCNTSESGKVETTPVDHYGEKSASPCGAWDMAGNVWEWCSSLYKEYPYDLEDGRENPSGTSFRVLRGGSCRDDASYARCAVRYWFAPHALWHSRGFRVCLVGASTA